MDYLDLLKVGSPLALALIIIWKVAEANLKALNSQRDDFMKVITNHMHEDIMMHQKTIETMNQLDKSINILENTQKISIEVNKRLLDFLNK